MEQIKGKYATAFSYATTIEGMAKEQIKAMCDQEFAKGSKIRIMPDAHAGKGCTIGTTMTVTDKVVPNIVGVDIGCGMFTVKLGKKDIDFKILDEVAYYIPSGMNVWDEVQEEFDLTKLRCYDHLKRRTWLAKSLGTLGGGNHFIEVDEAVDGTKYLVIHSGSRNLGVQVADYYQETAVEILSGKEEYYNERERILTTYKELGKEKEIQTALKNLVWDRSNKSIPDELCYVSGKYLDDYLHDVELCQLFARKNRERMAKIILQRTGLSSRESFHTVHNYIDTNERIIRKGAISAREGEKLLIPINMRDGSILAKGKGNPEWNYSAPHGAGRIMSRKKALSTLDIKAYKEAMKGIYTTSVNKNTLDEAPMAYKSLNEIIGAIRESVDIIEVLKPIYNFKAGE